MSASDEAWLARWLDAVRDDPRKMSQRALSAIERRGGIDAAVAAATARGLHLVALTDEHGRELVAASRHPFRTLC